MSSIFILNHDESSATTDSNQYFYGMTLDAKNKNTQKKIKKEIAKNFHLINEFNNYQFVTFSTNEDILSVTKKIGKYGHIENLSELNINLFSTNISSSDSDQINDDWNLEMIKSPFVNNNFSLSGSGITVGVMDTGIQQHSDLSDNVLNFHICSDLYMEGAGCDSTETILRDFNFKGAGHGTNTAGIISSTNFGVSPNANLIDFDLFSNISNVDDINLSKSATRSFEEVLIQLDNGTKIDILNMSFGWEEVPGLDNIFIEGVLKEIYNQGVIIVAATGNDESIYYNYPASYDFVIGVSNLSSDKTLFLGGDIYDGSTYGDMVDLTAPGQTVLTTDLNNNTTQFAGTSAAAPHISGILALYKENYPSFSSDEITGMLFEAAEDLGDVGKDIKYGYGLPTAEPPKHFVTNDQIQLNGSYKIYSFADGKALNPIDPNEPNKSLEPIEQNLSGSYKFSRATGWDEAKKRFEYYRIHDLNTDEVLGWIKADDTMNNIEADRESFTFTSDTLKIYSDANEASYEETITINPDRIREHVSEDKAGLNPETGLYDWYKVNIPEYEISNKWIYFGDSQFVTNQNAYSDIVFDLSYGSFSLDIYDNPDSSISPTQINGTYNQKIFIDKGYEWVSSKTGFKWYRVSIPSLGIENKWVDAGTSQWGNIYQYGLMNNVAGRSTEENNVLYFDNIIKDSTYEVRFSPNGSATYQFEQPVSINDVLFRALSTSGLSNLKLELFDEDKELLYDTFISSVDNSSFYLKLSKQIDNVSSYKITNTAEVNQSISMFDVFGTFDEPALPPKSIEFEQTLNEFSYVLYDEPNLNTNSQTLSNTRNKIANITKGYYWVEENNGYKWYQISIPALGVVDKWVFADAEWDDVYKYGLMNSVSGRSIEESGIQDFEHITTDYLYKADILANGFVTYRFEQPINVERVLIRKYQKTLNPDAQLKLELFDVNNNFLSDYNITADDYFKQDFELPATVNGVYYYKLSNTGTESISLQYFDLLGSYGTTALSGIDFNFSFYLPGYTSILYDEPNLNSPSVVVSNTRSKLAIVSKGYHWIEDKNGYRWYQISVPELSVIDKWINIGDSNAGNIHENGLMDSVTGSVFEELDVDYFSRITYDSTSATNFLPGGYVTYHFDTPINIESLFIRKEQKMMNPNTELKIDFFDENFNLINEYYFTEEDYFKQHLKLPTTVNNVHHYRLTNYGIETISIKYFDLFN